MYVKSVMDVILFLLYLKYMKNNELKIIQIIKDVCQSFLYDEICYMTLYNIRSKLENELLDKLDMYKYQIHLDIVNDVLEVHIQKVGYRHYGYVYKIYFNKSTNTLVVDRNLD